MIAFRRNSERKPIKRLYDGHVFGEIGAITNLRRTCTVITYETCVFLTIER